MHEKTPRRKKITYKLTILFSGGTYLLVIQTTRVRINRHFLVLHLI